MGYPLLFVNTSSELNMRGGPSLSDAITQILNPGEVLLYRGDPTDADGYRWFSVFCARIVNGTPDWWGGYVAAQNLSTNNFLAAPLGHLRYDNELFGEYIRELYITKPCDHFDGCGNVVNRDSLYTEDYPGTGCSGYASRYITSVKSASSSTYVDVPWANGYDGYKPYLMRGNSMENWIYFHDPCVRSGDGCAGGCIDANLKIACGDTSQYPFDAHN